MTIRLLFVPLLLIVSFGAFADVRLSTLPTHVYRIDDEGKFQTESWYFELVVHDSSPRQWAPVSLQTETMSAGKVVKKTSLGAAALAPRQRRKYRSQPDMPKLTLRHHFAIPDEAFMVPLLFSELRSDAIDNVRVTIALESGDLTRERTLIVPIEKFVQKTKLIFPFKGPAIVTQGNFNNGGHVHRETMFAIDAMALTPVYAPMLSEEERNETIAGWGKEILAPADGKVVYSRNDVPTNPLYTPDEAAYSALPEPIWAIAGNCVVIDHGNGEFSALMHMQQGSVSVRAGDAVKQGQVIGRLGNSGDSYMPHLHYQLTTGGLLFASDGLPAKFENVDKKLTRGTYFTAR